MNDHISETHPAPDRPGVREEPQALDCPHCGVSTFHLKSYRLTTILCLYILVVVKSRQAVACPTCMRRLIWNNALNNVLPANLTWPYILLESVAYDLASRTASHSAEITEAIRIPTKAEINAASLTGVGVGAAFGSVLGAILGGFLGLISGKLASKWAIGQFGKEWSWTVGVIGTVLGSAILALLFPGNRCHLGRTALWLVVSTACWVSLWAIGGNAVEHAVGSESYYWLAGGAIIGILTICQGLAATGGRMNNEMRRAIFYFLFPLLAAVLIAILLRFRIGFRIAGAIGGVVGGVAAGALVGVTAEYFGGNGDYLTKAEIGAALGALLGLMGGVSGGASIESPSPVR